LHPLLIGQPLGSGFRSFFLSILSRIQGSVRAARGIPQDRKVQGYARCCHMDTLYYPNKLESAGHLPAGMMFCWQAPSVSFLAPGRYVALRRSCSFVGLKGRTKEGTRSASVPSHQQVCRVQVFLQLRRAEKESTQEVPSCAIVPAPSTHD